MSESEFTKKTGLDPHFACRSFPKCDKFPEGCFIENPPKMPDFLRDKIEKGKT